MRLERQALRRRPFRKDSITSMENDLKFIKRQAQIFDHFVASFNDLDDEEEAPTPDLEQLLPEDSCS